MNLTAGPPLEPGRYRVGRRTTLLVDPDRSGRMLGVDIWYPTFATEGAPSTYELFPGVSFEAAGAFHEAPAGPGTFPLIVFSHGRTGVRFAYSLVCEALAARGAVVVSSDHPGDALTDWLLGTNTDDRTNEVNRVADAHLVLRALLHGDPNVPVDVLNAIDHSRVALAGHSYGAYTALATAAGARGVESHDRVRAAVVFQPYTRIMSDSLLGRVPVPVLLVVSELDRVTPPETDAERPWSLLRARPVWRLDVLGAGHQAISDIALYAELAEHIDGLPQIVIDYLASTAADAAGPAGTTWRELMRLQVEAAWAFLDEVMELGEPEERAAATERLEASSAVTFRRR